MRFGIPEMLCGKNGDEMNSIINSDMARIYSGLTDGEKQKLKGSTILITGCGGFLGYYFSLFFTTYAQDLQIKKIIGLDNFIVGCPPWLQKLSDEKKIELYKFDIISDDISQIPDAENVTHVLHMASIASPTFYRKYPIETLDANIWGLRSLLEYYKDKSIKGFLFFSSSEIYGNPSPENIPTPETYNGNVSSLGPRACYDEAKRFGETICYLFNQKYGLPITVVRPFNNYGPGMRLNDKRVPADFANAICNNEDIIILSDGSPTRTFCYISDAITGYLKVLLYGKFDVFNIGIDNPEVSVKRLAEIYREQGTKIMNYSGNIHFGISNDSEYLTNNPDRRCPNITKARTLLGYNPQVDVYDGVGYFLKYIKESNPERLTW